MIDLRELVREGVISPTVAERIEQYYLDKKMTGPSRLLIAFAILGGLLIGLGILLILAHNWDQLSTPVKTTIAFIPLGVSQILAGFALLKRDNSVSWREGTSILLCCSVAISISVISQIYHISGSTASFLLTWMLLSLPIVYVMRAATVSLIYLVAITWFAGDAGYWGTTLLSAHWYWLLLVGPLPFYLLLIKRTTNSNFTYFHHWLIPLSLTCALGIMSDTDDYFMFMAYVLMFGVFILIGSARFLHDLHWLKNGYSTVGTLGNIVLGLILTFSWYWEDLAEQIIHFRTVEFMTISIIVILYAILIIWKIQRESIRNLRLIHFYSLIFLVVFLLGAQWPLLGQIAANLVVLAIGIDYIRRGALQTHLGTLNFGLITIAVLIGCRFFDADWSFVWRGTVFVILGVGFILANYYLLKVKGTHEN